MAGPTIRRPRCRWPAAGAPVGAVRRRRSIVALVATASVVAVLGSGCSLRGDSQPQVISAESLPHELFSPAGTSTIPSSEQQKVGVYLVQALGQSPTLQRYEVAVDPKADPYTDAITKLLAVGPNAPPNLASDIPQQTAIRSVIRETGSDVLDVDLSNLSLDSTNLKVAIAQIVFTAMDLPSIAGVRLKIDGQPTAVPVDDGSANPGAVVTRNDFKSLEPGATTTTMAPLPTPPSTDAPQPPPATG
jgi:hypothetical protein